MKNRSHKKKKRQSPEELKTFFLACEFKPFGDLWSILDPFAYDVKPAFIYGSLGIINYNPESYSIIDINDQSQPLMGYICTITEPTTGLLLDKIKGFNGYGSFNMHVKKIVPAYTDLETVVDAWAYCLSERVLDEFQQIEQISFGIWSDDEKQIELLEEI